MWQDWLLAFLFWQVVFSVGYLLVGLYRGFRAGDRVFVYSQGEPDMDLDMRQYAQGIVRQRGLEAFMPEMPFAGANPTPSPDHMTALFHPVAMDAERKSIELLKEWLSPAQCYQFEKNGTFFVTGSNGGKFRIRGTTIAYNIDALGSDGKPVERWCFQPRDIRATGDVMLAQKIVLETDEKRAEAVSNKTKIGVDGEPIYQPMMYEGGYDATS